VRRAVKNDATFLCRGADTAGGANASAATAPNTIKEKHGLQSDVARGSASERLTRAEAVWLWIVLLVGAALIFWRLADKSLTPDEAFSYRQAIAPLPVLIHVAVYGDFHPPLFALVFHYLNGWLHWPAPYYRYLTAPFGLVTILATWALTRRWFGFPAAAIAGLVAATMPMLVSEDRLFRMYVVVTALAMASWWLLMEAQDALGARRRWLWLAYGVVVIAIPYTLYLGAFVILAQAIYALVRRGSALPAAAWAVAAALALIPWSWAIRIQLPNGAFPGAAVDLVPVARAVLLMTPPQSWISPGFDIAIGIAALAIIVGACWIGRATPLPYLFIPLALQVAISIGFRRDLLVYRYVALSLPVFAIAVAAVAMWLLRSPARVAGALLVLIVLAANSVALANYFLDPYYQTTDWYAIEIALHQHAQRGDALIFNQMEPYLVVEDSPDVKGREVYLMSYPAPPQAAIAWLDAHPHARIWYIENQADFSDPQRLVLKHLVATRPLLYSMLQKHASLANWALLDLFGETSPVKR